MITGYAVRPAGPEDVDALPDVERAAATRFGDSLPQSVLSHVTSLNRLMSGQRDGLLWVAVGPDGAPVGFALASIGGRRLHLEELDVAPEHGRTGLGSALIGAVESDASDRGLAAITLTTFRDVPWNAPFYARLGFETVPEQDLDPEMRERLAREAEIGLDPRRRVAMRKLVSTAHGERVDFVVFLRGISNVPMQPLRDALTGLGLDGVRSFGGTGNLMFSAQDVDRDVLERRIAAAVGVDAFVRTRGELRSIVDGDPFAGRPGAAVLVTHSAIDPATVAAFMGEGFEGEPPVIDGAHVYFVHPLRRPGRMAPLDLERELGIRGTMRASRVLARILETT